MEQVQPRAAVRITTGVDGAAKAARVAGERAVKDIQGRTADEETFAKMPPPEAAELPLRVLSETVSVAPPL